MQKIENKMLPKISTFLEPKPPFFGQNGYQFVPLVNQVNNEIAFNDFSGNQIFNEVKDK